MDKAYLHFTVDEFIGDEYFQRWVRYPDRETNNFWKKWLADHPEKRDEVMKASAFISNLSFRTESPGKTQVENALSKNLQRLEEKEEGIRNKQAGATNKKLMLTGLVLSAALLIFTLWQSFEHDPEVIETRTAKNEIKTLPLPDGSVVTLNGNSSLKYASDLALNKKREVWLQGEAFFDVKQMKTGSDPAQFIVHNDALNIEVVGTTFNVKKRADIYNVSLNSGTLKIRLENDQGSVYHLKPGDFFQYSTKEKFIVKKKVQPELYSQWKEQKLVLDNTPLTEIAEMIEDTYGYRTIIQDRELQDDKISGTIVLTNEDAFFEALSFALNIEILKKDKDIIFQSKRKIQ